MPSKDSVTDPECPNPTETIVDVWKHNFDDELRRIRVLVEQYNYISMVSFSLSFIYLLFSLYTHISSLSSSLSCHFIHYLGH